MSLKAVLFGSSYKWGHMVSPTVDKKVSAPPPSLHWPLGQPLWPRGRPCHLYHRKKETWKHVDVSGQQEPVLVWTMNMSTPLGLSCNWTYLHHRARAAPVMSGQKDSVLVWTCPHHWGLSCTWTYLHHRARAVAPVLVWTKGFCVGLDMSTP